jgi:hypothetical protein
MQRMGRGLSPTDTRGRAAMAAFLKSYMCDARRRRSFSSSPSSSFWNRVRSRSLITIVTSPLTFSLYYSGDLLCTVRTENGQLLPLSDTSSVLVVPDAKRPLWSVRHAQLASHEIVLGNRPGLLLQGNPRYFVPFINCPDTGLWLIRLLPPPTLHNRIYPIHLATNSIAQDTRLQDHERLGHISFKRMRQLEIDGITPPTSKRLKPITCPVCITAKARRANRPAPSTPADRPTEPWQDVYTDLSGKVRTTSVTGAKYFAVFVDSYSGSKHIEFMNSKNHFIFPCLYRSIQQSTHR